MKRGEHGQNKRFGSSVVVRDRCPGWPWPASARAQAPAAGPPPPAACNRRGRLHRMFHHSAHTVQDKFVGYPETFIEPPLGYYVTEQLCGAGRQGRHPSVHPLSQRLPARERPVFAERGVAVQHHVRPIPELAGPISVEWTPDQPALAESRRQAVLDDDAEGGPADPGRARRDRPSPYPGAMGIEAIEQLLQIPSAAARRRRSSFPLPPTESASTGVH